MITKCVFGGIYTVKQKQTRTLVPTCLFRVLYNNHIKSIEYDIDMLIYLMCLTGSISDTGDRHFC